MNAIEQFLSTEPFIVLDGGGATELEKAGIFTDPLLWYGAASLDAPDAVRDMHRRYIRAGARIIKSVTYQASYEGFKKAGRPRDYAPAVQAAVRLAREAADEAREKVLVAASLGPYGAMLADGSEYSGRYHVSDADLLRFHRARVETLLEAGATLFALETIPLAEEAALLAELASDYDLEAWMSFQCRSAFETAAGDELAHAVRLVEAFECLSAVGVNCLHPDLVLPILHVLQDNSMGPFIVYPNTRGHWDKASAVWQADEPSDDFYVLGARWYEAGARLIGGCCHSTPTNVRRLSDLFLDIRAGARI